MTEPKWDKFFSYNPSFGKKTNIELRPSGIDTNSNSAYNGGWVADEGNNRLVPFGSIKYNFVEYPPTSVNPNRPIVDVAVGSNDFTLHALGSNGHVYTYDVASLSDGYTQWGSYGSNNGQFKNPNGIAVDSSGNVFVSDTGNNRIQQFTSSGDHIKTWGY